MDFVVGAFATWLVEQVADASRKRLVALLAGDEYERALRKAADAAIQLTAEDFYPTNGIRAEYLGSVIDQVFGEPASVDPTTGQATLLQALQAGIAARLEPLDDARLTGTGQSSAELLGVSGMELAQQLATHLVREIINRGARGGPLASLANQLSHNETQLQVRGLSLVIKEVVRERDRSPETASRDCRGLVRSLVNGRQRVLIRPHVPFFGREAAILQAKRRLQPDTILPVVGVDRSGKTEFIAQLLGANEYVSELASRFPLPLSLLQVNLRDHFGQRRVLRGLAYALNIDNHEELLDFQEDTITAEIEVRGTLLGELVPDRLHASSPIAIFENVSEALADEKSRADLNAILAMDLFRDGSVLLTGTKELDVDGDGYRMRAASIHIGALSPDEVRLLLNFYVHDPALVSSATSQTLALPELLLPGLIKQGIANFTRRVDEGTIEYGADALAYSILEALEGSVWDLLKPLGLTEVVRDGALTPLATLFVMAVLARFPITESMLQSAELPIPPSGLTSGYGAFVEVVEEYTRGPWFRLTDFGQRSLRLALSPQLRPQFQEELVGGCRHLLHVFQQTSFLAPEDFAPAIEEALAWVERALPEEVGLKDVLSSYLILETAGALSFPFSEQESDALQIRLSAPSHVSLASSEAISQLVLAARFGHDKDVFLDRLRAAARAVRRDKTLSMSQLRSFDTATFVGTMRYHCPGEVLQIRQGLIPLILQCSSAHADMGLRSWTVSWLLNTANVALRAYDQVAAAKALEKAEEQLASLARPLARLALGNWLWLRSRRASLRAHLATTPEDRRTNLKLAAADAALALVAAGGGQTWARRYFRAARGVLDEIPDDHERIREVDTAIEHVIGVYGELDNWPLHTRLQASALVRAGAQRTADEELRFELARKALDLIQPTEAKLVRMAKLGDVRGVLLLARTYRLLARCRQRLGQPPAVWWNAAMRWCKLAIESVPTAPAWELLLRMIDEESDDSLWDPADMATAPREISKRLGHEIQHCESWLSGLSTVGPQEGSAALWCVDRRWRAQGDISEVAQAEIRPNWDWETMPRIEKLQALEHAYGTRRRQLERLETRFGPFAKLSMKKAFLEGQYQRLVALQTDHRPATALVLALFEEAQRRWPDNLAILIEKGRFFRWTWQYAEAIEAFDRVIYGSNDGDKRRDAAVRQVETLLISALHCAYIKFPDGTQSSRKDLIGKARQLLPYLSGFHETSFEATLLRDRVLYEAGEEIDWPALDMSYNLVVGDIGKYPQTVMYNLETLLREKHESPKSLAELIRQEFTTVEALKHMGLLYLRRAEKRDGDVSLYSLQAYATFGACSILERSWSDRESPVTSYNRARIILTAAEQQGSLNPFSGEPDGHHSWVHLAEARLQSAADRSVGLFYEAARQKLVEVRRLMNQPGINS
jgi:hypothetical protein